MSARELLRILFDLVLGLSVDHLITLLLYIKVPMSVRHRVLEARRIVLGKGTTTVACIATTSIHYSMIARTLYIYIQVHVCWPYLVYRVDTTLVQQVYLPLKR